MGNLVKPHSFFTDFDIDLFNSGKHFRLYEKFGSHITEKDGERGVYFSVYAPSAKSVELIGDFNYWNGEKHVLLVRWDSSGIWEGFIAGLKKGDLYKYRIYSNLDEKVRDKADPYAKKYEMPPKTASIVWNNEYLWHDENWLKNRPAANNLNAPMSIYELHLGSWKKNNDGYSLSYKELATELCTYVTTMGYTHVELMPVMEHPYYPSWGYLCTGYFAPTSRYGDPEELMYLVDSLHTAGIGVFLDWVPAHFPSDEHALADFDGSKLYENPDKQKGFHPDWNSLIFNFERAQIRSFLISSAHFWCNQFHADGLRVDAVASILYLNYSRYEGEWTPNIYGGNENLDAIQFIKDLNIALYKDFPGIQMMAEESTAFTGVSKPVDVGGLGFGMKWMMGWMNDSLEFFQRDPIYRKYHHNDISRSLTYAFTENYLLPLSHDEVVHGKQSLLHKMPGDDWQKFANLRLLFTYMFTHPGQKLIFMGGDFGQRSEWNVNQQLEWHLLQHQPHQGVANTIKKLNQLYKNEKALHGNNFSPDGFEWIDYNDSENSVISFIRKSDDKFVVVVLNFSPVVRNNYTIGVPKAGLYTCIFNSDEEAFGGSGVSIKNCKSKSERYHNKAHSITLTLSPLAGIILKMEK